MLCTLTLNGNMPRGLHQGIFTCVRFVAEIPALAAETNPFKCKGMFTQRISAAYFMPECIAGGGIHF